MKIFLKCFSVALMIFSVLFAFTFKSGFCLGDVILQNIGLNAWSSGNVRTHYSVIYGLAILIVAFATYSLATKQRLKSFLLFIGGFSIVLFLLMIS